MTTHVEVFVYLWEDSDDQEEDYTCNKLSHLHQDKHPTKLLARVVGSIVVSITGEGVEQLKKNMLARVFAISR